MKPFYSRPLLKQWSLVIISILVSGTILAVVKRIFNIEFPMDMVVWAIGFGVWYRNGGQEILLRAKQRSLSKKPKSKLASKYQMDALSRLCSWYVKQCVDEWQEEYGVHIDTLDNPGWSVKIDLVRTALQEKPFQEVKFERSEHDWITARRNTKQFEAFGGPNNLHEMIEIFLSWAAATEQA